MSKKVEQSLLLWSCFDKNSVILGRLKLTPGLIKFYYLVSIWILKILNPRGQLFEQIDIALLMSEDFSVLLNLVEVEAILLLQVQSCCWTGDS